MSTQPTKAAGPIETLIKERITEALAPTSLDIINDSDKHRHHSAMRGVTSTETHFRVKIVSDRFTGLSMIKRHREIYGLLKDKMIESGGIHALTLDTKTVAEIEKASNAA
ncbi:BolA domain UV induced protein Uvi31 [Coemansia sp. RSA 2706]|nr:BolA domain UV induced protein Uvi31 [Coemansia sp. RSA 2706]KAJ2314668.1 BolA domain UV induced protein Uvi31 [Coemansia sp. RSA 2705]KAJ2321554.1 BolA domain UV induced protein Uvi31 [Coemansia sp. RSA 2704]KAJ2330003.1 BolA domain UV induced protein Uvi31 [Coemansia sp. RSA 2702]KAJ2369410.1 BolA domain UV induced protein Uvi31 [Coemansia sp. RSA 2610]KAJ2393468.1 BolA domain UV induced protein Uvi31 [Coemansia sp. RSA 2611]KAJ2739818.1 BolA domain UV induced protein Uvi31 [Coemansia sp